MIGFPGRAAASILVALLGCGGDGSAGDAGSAGGGDVQELPETQSGDARADGELLSDQRWQEVGGDAADVHALDLHEAGSESDDPGRDETDTDADGVSDEQEKDEGTDPYDPSSASMWHPEWTGYPRLVFGAGDVPALREKSAAPPYPLDVMLARVRQKAAAAPAPPRIAAYDPYHEVARAEIAKAAAFAALLDLDAAMADKAEEIVLGLNPHVEEIGFDSPFYTKVSIHAAEAIVYFCQAYDFVAGSGLLSQDRLDAMEARIAELVSSVTKEAVTGPMAVLLMAAQNNHNIKVFAAIGLAGITFNSRPEAALWVDRGLTDTLYWTFDFQSTSDGAWAEGPGYLNYCAGELMAFVQAYHRFAQGKPYYFRKFFDLHDPVGSEYEWIPDPAGDSRLRDIFLWPIKTMMPDGLSPNVDDSARSPLPSGYLAAFFNDAVFLWHWELPAVGLSSLAGIDLAADIFSLLPEDMAPSPPDFDPDQFLPDGGHCVFRDSLTPDSGYLLLLGENGKARDNGQGHEHPDASQLLIHHAGEYLLIDSGYVSWEKKDAVCHVENHNLILVDGKGPPDSEYLSIGTDTFLSGFEVTDDYETCASSTQYEGVQLMRRVVRLPQGVMVVLDKLQSAKQHEYTLAWHGNGGGTSGGDFLSGDSGGSWIRSGASLAAACASTHSATAISSKELSHSFSYGSLLSHETLHCGFKGSSTSALTVFRLGPGGAAPDLPEVLEAGTGTAVISVAVEGGVVVAAASDAPEVSTPCGKIDTATGFSVAVCDTDLAPFHVWKFPHANFD